MTNDSRKTWTQKDRFEPFGVAAYMHAKDMRMMHYARVATPHWDQFYIWRDTAQALLSIMFDIADMKFSARLYG